MSEDSDALDSILTKLGSKFGLYQIKNYFFISVPLLFSAMFTLSYVFTARNLNYRCYVPECDQQLPNYNSWWLKNAIPFKDGEPLRCERFPIRNNNLFSETNLCPSDLFLNNVTERCDKFVFSTDDVTIMNEFDLMCDENTWKLTIVGTVNNIGEFFVQPITGFISDRYGRKFRMLSGLLISIVMGLSRSLSTSYLWFLFFEFLDTALGSGAFACAFILGMELVSPDKRVLAGSIVSSAYALGEAALAILAMYVHNWRVLLRSIYISGLALMSLFWLMPESLRWMLSKGQTEKVKRILRKAADMNNVELSEDLLDSLDCEKNQKVLEPEKNDYPIGMVFKSRTLVLRLVTCSFCWITCAFVFFGLTLNSVAVSGNLYLNFVFVGLVEIPAYVIMSMVANRIGRRVLICSSFILSGTACLAFIFLSSEMPVLKLIAFLTGKFGITIAFTLIYVFTAELFPTSLRHSMVGTCSMFARIGSMTAPQTPLLGQVFKALPVMLFGGMCLISGLLCLTLPETLNIKLPDTIEEAENISKQKQHVRNIQFKDEYMEVKTS